MSGRLSISLVALLCGGVFAFSGCGSKEPGGLKSADKGGSEMDRMKAIEEGRSSSADPGARGGQSSSQPGSEIPADVRDTVKGFIAALHDWETEAWRDSEASEGNDEAEKKADKRIREARKTMLEKWCCKDLKPQGMAYGNHPSHDPDREVLISAALSGDECRVRTRMPGESGSPDDYEYHLRKEEGVWKIKQLYFDNGEELAPCL